jgi:cell fate regulator YaaT (PSP1 superfamily)
MNELLELEFKGRRTEYAANPLQYPFKRGDLAIVTTDRGQDLGKVAHVGIREGDAPGDKISLTVLRKAKSPDVEKLGVNREREREAKQLAKTEIERHKLDMKLVDVELQWDGRKLTFYFTAEGRVDFRDLVRELATKFRTRIDLRQIGARDETKKISGYGVCGRPLCCATFLTEFKPITTQMPRDQYLPLNPSKLSGVCGRLKCCLRYELDIYKEFQRDCPKLGHPIKDDEKGMGEVDKLDVIREQIQVRYSNGTLDRYTKEQFVDLTNWRPQMPKNECICTCGKKTQTAEAAPAGAPARTEAPAPQSEAGRGDRITLRGEGGFRVDFEDEESSVDISTDVSVSMDSSARKKRKRKKKRPGEASAQATHHSHDHEPHDAASETQPQTLAKAQAPTQAQDSADGEGDQSPARKKRRRGGRRRRGGGGGSGEQTSADSGDHED